MTMAKKPKRRSTPSLCPQCKILLQRKVKYLRSHFRSIHGRLPTKGEEFQFIAYQEIPTPYSDGDFKKPHYEVSGGAVSPR